MTKVYVNCANELNNRGYRVNLTMREAYLIDRLRKKSNGIPLSIFSSFCKEKELKSLIRKGLIDFEVR